MKKIFLFLVLPFLFAFQCEDDVDSGFETSYIIQNGSNTDLFLLTESDSFVEISSQTEISIASDLNSVTEPILPTESFLFNSIRLYRSENENFILSYSQEPLDDEVWQLTEPTTNRFEYTLVITDADLN